MLFPRNKSVASVSTIADIFYPELFNAQPYNWKIKDVIYLQVDEKHI